MWNKEKHRASNETEGFEWDRIQHLEVWPTPFKASSYSIKQHKHHCMQVECSWSHVNNNENYTPPLYIYIYINIYITHLFFFQTGKAAVLHDSVLTFWNGLKWSTIISFLGEFLLKGMESMRMCYFLKVIFPHVLFFGVMFPHVLFFVSMFRMSCVQVVIFRMYCFWVADAKLSPFSLRKYACTVFLNMSRLRSTTFSAMFPLGGEGIYLHLPFGTSPCMHNSFCPALNYNFQEIWNRALNAKHWRNIDAAFSGSFQETFRKFSGSPEKHRTTETQKRRNMKISQLGMLTSRKSWLWVYSFLH